MKSIRYRFIVAAIAVMLGSVIAKSQTTDAPPPPPMHGGMEHEGMGMDGHMLGFYAKALGVTDEQKTQMKAVLHKEHATMKPLMTQVHLLDQQLKQYVEGTYDAAKVHALVSQQAQTLVQVKVEESRIHNELYSMLTADQQAKLKEIEAKHEARMQERMNAAPTAAPEE
jgi:Spy/CpxP family protein refolding chaperone